MGWRGNLRTIGAIVRAQERDARRRANAARKAAQQRHREYARYAAQSAKDQARAEAAARKEAELASAQAEVEEYEARVEELTSVHRGAVRTVDWAAIANAPAPAEPVLDRSASQRASAELAAYRPGFFERVFGIGSGRPALEIALREAAVLEDQAFAQAQRDHHEQVEQWRAWAVFSTRVLKADLVAYQEAVEGTGCLDELVEVLGAANVAVSYESTLPTVVLAVDEDTVVPTESKSLTARGAASAKKLAAAARFEIYQDYVCGAALRAARELLAVLPVRGVLVHVDAPLLDRATGNFVRSTIVSAYCPREAIEAANWDRADASDFTERLLHAMKLARGKSFARVDRIALPRS